MGWEKERERGRGGERERRREGGREGARERGIEGSREVPVWSGLGGDRSCVFRISVVQCGGRAPERRARERRMGRGCGGGWWVLAATFVSSAVAQSRNATGELAVTVAARARSINYG